jgi:hypothetical protein
MKNLLLIVSVFVALGFNLAPNCDKVIYANKQQTEYDDRFNNYEKINGIPKIKGGDKKLDKIIRKNLKLSETAKTQFFMLNYQFTVNCEGEIKDVKQIGDPKADSWTNIKEVIMKTEGFWKPAKHKGKPVNCIYFSRISINGGDY